MREDLQSRVNELENKMTADGDEQMILQYEKCRSELEAMYDHITQGMGYGLRLIKFQRKI